jgi:hypothetical protein
MTYLRSHLADLGPTEMRTFAPIVKQFVADEIVKLDKTVSIFSTEYFDHAFAPDLVMRWGSQRSERFVYLRAGDPTRFLFEDTRLLTDTKPLVVSIDAEREANERHKLSGADDTDQAAEADAADEAIVAIEPELRAKALDSDTLLLGIDATVDMTNEAQTDTAVRLLAQGLLQGGRGVANQEFVREASANVRSGFAGAEVGDVAVTARLIQTLTTSLAATEASRMTRVLRAIWDGNGQDSSRFPGSDSLGPLGDDDLRYLIASLDSADERFWRRVANGVDIEQLARVGSASQIDSLASFQSLARARTEHLKGKAIRAVPVHASLLETEVDEPRWAVLSATLTLRTARADFMVAARSQKEFPATSTETSSLSSRALRDDILPTFDTYVTRRKRLGARISMVELDQGSGNRVIFDSREPGKEFDDDAVRPNVTASSRIRRVATSCDGTDVEADFGTGTLGTRTSGKASIVAMIDVASAILVDLPTESRQTLKSFLRMADQVSLFAGTDDVADVTEPVGPALFESDDSSHNPD